MSTATKASSSSVTLTAGTILPFASDNTSSLQGWRVCDGASLPADEFPDLFNVIGNSNGGNASQGQGMFNIPDLRARFLRGASTTNMPGTVLPSTTQNPFSVQIPHMPDTYYSALMFALFGPSMEEFNSGSTSFPIGRGDNETRPANVYMNFIIKLDNHSKIPTGVLVPYAGADGSTTKPDDVWLFCDNHTHNAQQYPGLYRTISTRFTSPTEASGVFNVPQPDGLFIRGADNGATRDPDASSRDPAPDGTTGPYVGTTQKYGTKPGSDWQVTIANCPAGGTETCNIAAGHDNLVSGSDSTTVTFIGGANETRPNNCAVSYYCLSNDSTAEAFPVGGIIAVPGSYSPDGNWLSAKGQPLQASDYPLLYSVIGNAWGGDSTTFNLPNLQDKFLRATDFGTSPNSNNPDQSSRVASAPGGTVSGTGSAQTFATGTPQIPLQVTGLSYPTTDHENAATAIGYHISDYNPGPTTYALSGGDSETAPISVVVNFYVRVV